MCRPATGIMGGEENAVHLITADGVEDWPRLGKAGGGAPACSAHRGGAGMNYVVRAPRRCGRRCVSPRSAGCAATASRCFRCRLRRRGAARPRAVRRTSGSAGLDPVRRASRMASWSGSLVCRFRSGAKERHKAHLFSMYVDAAHRRTGLAQQLVRSGHRCGARGRCAGAAAYRRRRQRAGSAPISPHGLHRYTALNDARCRWAADSMTRN